MEQDTYDLTQENELPSYLELAAKADPNSRFGRWKDWVEKRAAERYTDLSPGALEKRRARGWGEGFEDQEPGKSSSPGVLPPDRPVTPLTGLRRTETILSIASFVSPTIQFTGSPATPATPATTTSELLSAITHGQTLPPSHLRLHSFGSRFLPHSELPILSCLPLFNHQKLLLGHVDGLTLLDMNPEADPSDPSDPQSYGPQRREVWYGQGVYQMEILHQDQSQLSQTPSGVVLALVGSEPPETLDKEMKGPFKTLRMYNLASLASLVRWTAARKALEPLDLSRNANRKKHRKSHSITGLLSMKHDEESLTAAESPSGNSPPPVPPKDWPRSSGAASFPEALPSKMGSPTDPGDDHDVPLRWAADFVQIPLPTRLAGQSVLFFELQKENDGGRIVSRLAVAVKQCILVYETVRGERALRFVKEFLTPSPARGVKFVTQRLNEQPLLKAVRGAGGPFTMVNPGPSSSPSRRVVSLGTEQPAYRPGQLSLFVVFEKKAGLIRLADSSVDELALWEHPAGHARRAPSVTSFMSFGDYASPATKGAWVPPATVYLPLSSSFPLAPGPGAADARTVYLLTRGCTTHIVPAPLPMPLGAHEPLAVLEWGMRPTRVVPRACEHPRTGMPFLQVTALGAEGVEVQEMELEFLGGVGRAGKGREGVGALVGVRAAVGPGGAGYLCAGGHWTETQRFAEGALGGTRAGTGERRGSVDTVDTVEMVTWRARAAGFYAWTQYAGNDWRVFWLGGEAGDGEVSPISP